MKLETGAKIKTQQWDGKGSLVTFVLKKNLHRRDISSSQRAVVALNAEKEYAEEAKERQRQAAQEMLEKRWGDEPLLPQFSEEATDNEEKSDRAPTTHTTSSRSSSSAKASASQKTKDKKKTDGEAAQQAAEAAGTNRDYVFKAKFLQQHAPDLLKQVEIGKLTITQAIKQVKAEQKAAERAAEVAAMQLEVKGNYAPDIIHGDALESSQPDP